MSYTDDFLTERARRDSRRQKGPSNEQRSERRARNVERFNARQAVNDEAAIASVAHGNVIVDAATARPSSLARTPEERAQQERAGRFLPRVGRGVAFAPEAFVLNPLGNPAMRAEIERARRQDHVEANGSYDIDPETGEGVSTLPVINANVPRPQGSVARSVRNAAAAAGDVARAAPGFVGAAAKEMFVDTPIRAATGFEEAGARLERGDKTGAVAPALRATEDTIYTGLNAELGLLGLGLARTGARAATNAAAPHAARAGRAMRDAVGEVGIRRAPAPAPRMRGGMAPVDVSEAALSPVPVRPARRIDPVKKMRADAGEPVDAGALFPRAGALSDQAPRPGNASQGAPFNPVGANPGQQGGRANWRMVRLPYDQPPLNVVKNPSEGDLMRLRRESASPSDEFRFVTDEEGNLYVANAMNAEHAWLREGLAEQGIKTVGAGDIRRAEAGWQRSTGWNSGEYIPYDPRRRAPISDAERVSARADKIIAGAVGADEQAIIANLRADLRDATASGDSEWAAGLREAIARLEGKGPAERPRNMGPLPGEDGVFAPASRPPGQTPGALDMSTEARMARAAEAGLEMTAPARFPQRALAQSQPKLQYQERFDPRLAATEGMKSDSPWLVEGGRQLWPKGFHSAMRRAHQLGTQGARKPSWVERPVDWGDGFSEEASYGLQTALEEAFKAGKAGRPMPTLTLAERHGAVEHYTISRNHANDVSERGLSVAGTRDPQTGAYQNRWNDFDESFAKGERRRVLGYENHGVFGSDGEPLLLAAVDVHGRNIRSVHAAFDPARRGDPDLIAAPGALSDDASRPGNAPDGAPQSGVFAPARPRQGEQSAGIGPETRRTRGARSENTSVLSDYADDMGWAEIAGRAGYASADSAKQNVNVILSRARARIKDGHSVEKVARENGTDAATLQRALSAQRTTPQMAGVDQALDARLRELRRTETVREAARIASEEFGRPVSIGMVQRAEARGRAARPQSMFPLAALGAASAVGGAAGDAEAQYYEYGHPRGRQTPFPAGPGEPASEPRAQEELPRAVRPNEPLSLPALALGALGAVTLRGGARAALSPNVRRAERALAEAPMGRGGRVPITVARRGGNAPQPGPFEFAAQRAAASRNLRDLGGDAAAVSGGGGGAYFGAAMDPNVRNDESRILYALGGASAGGIGSRVANEAGPLLSSLPRRTREEAIVHTPSPMELRRQARTRMLSDSPSTNPRSLRRKDPLIEGEHVRPLDREGLVRSVENGAVVWRRAAAETPPPRGTPRPVSPQEVNARVRARQSVKAGDDSPFPSMAYAPKGDDGPIPRVQYRYEKYKEPEWWGREPAWRRRIREEGGPSLPAPVPVKPKKPRTGLSPSSLRARVGNAEAVQQVPERAAQAGHSLPKGKSAAETMRNIKTRAQADLGFRAWLNRTFPAIALGLGVSAVGVERSVDENRDAR